jgi:hypothetical protein
MPCRPLWYNRFSHNWKLASLIHAMRDMLRRSSLAASTLKTGEEHEQKFS